MEDNSVYYTEDEDDSLYYTEDEDDYVYNTADKGVDSSTIDTAFKIEGALQDPRSSSYSISTLSCENLP